MFINIAEDQRKSLMDVALLSCAAPIGERHPKQLSLIFRQCGYTHNYMPVKSLDFNSMMSMPRDVAVCVRPLNLSVLEHDPSFVQFLEYWMHMGVNRMFLYDTGISQTKTSMLKKFKTENSWFLRVFNWNTIDKMTEIPVSDEAAVNHCVMNSLTSYRYIIVTSYDLVPVFVARKYNDLTQFVADPEFVKSIEDKSGFRISGPELHNPTFVIKPKDVLATAANHFIPLSAKSSFSILHPFDLTMLPLKTLWSHNDTKIDASNLKETVLQKLVMKNRTETWGKVAFERAKVS